MEQTQKIRHLQRKQTPVACKRLYLNPKKSFETGTFSTSAMVNMVSIDTPNERNLITGTRYLNIAGMLLFEYQVADYVQQT